MFLFLSLFKHVCPLRSNPFELGILNKNKTKRQGRFFYLNFFCLMCCWELRPRGTAVDFFILFWKQSVSVIFLLLPPLSICIYSHSTITDLFIVSPSVFQSVITISPLCCPLSWERMPTAGWWLNVMLCDWRVCPWCAVDPSIHEHELLILSWLSAGFPPLVLICHRRPLPLPCPLFHILCSIVWIVVFSSVYVSDSELSSAFIRLLSFVCQIYSEQSLILYPSWL